MNFEDELDVLIADDGDNIDDDHCNNPEVIDKFEKQRRASKIVSLKKKNNYNGISSKKVTSNYSSMGFTKIIPNQLIYN